MDTIKQGMASRVYVVAYDFVGPGKAFCLLFVSMCWDNNF